VIQSTSFDIWVIGNVQQWGSISDVNLVANKYGDAGSISITPTTTSGVTDPSTPGTPTDCGFMTDSQAQTQFAGTAFATGVSQHAEYANADGHRFWGLGNFTETDSPVDAFDHVDSDNQVEYVFAPNSHDATNVVPEPASVVLVGMGLTGLAVRLRRRT